MLRREEKELIDPADLSELWHDLTSGRIECVLVGAKKDHASAESSGSVIFPGAFDPLHQGHREMARIAQQMLDAPLAFELSLANVDKPALELDCVQQRLSQFSGHHVWVTQAATFVEKGSLFAGATFVVGIDTLFRIADPKYYDGDEAAMKQSIDQIEQAGCRFLTFGRHTGERFLTLSDLDLPESLLNLCQQVPPESFRVDLSSRELRRQNSTEDSNQ